MREKILNFLRVHPSILHFFWNALRVFFSLISFFIPIKKKTMLFSSFGGRKFDDSPKAIFEKIIKMPEFEDWKFTWAFVNPEEYDVSPANKVKIDTWTFFMTLLRSQVWVSNSGIDRGIGLKRNGVVEVETWHGTPLKKIGPDQNSGVLGNSKISKKIDKRTIRCAQSEYDRAIFERIFNAARESILLCDLPRNDELVDVELERVKALKAKLNIPDNKKVLLYMPTYREYLIDEKNRTYLAPPISLKKWKNKLGDNYVLLIRAHYAVSEALNLVEDDFVRDVSNYPFINDLYIIADVLISDYSSAFVDYSILKKPMLCFAYDLEEYSKKRGLYLDLSKELPCPIDRQEDDLIDHIVNLDYQLAVEVCSKFNKKYAPFAGHATESVIKEIQRRI